MTTNKFDIGRIVTICASVAVVALTAAVVGRAEQTIVTPNASAVSYNLAAGATSPPIAIVANTPVFVIGSQNTFGHRGVASATLLHIPASFIEWVGLESTAAAAITQGFSGTAGTHILYLDFNHLVDIQVASPDTIQIHNASTLAEAGIVKLIW